MNIKHLFHKSCFFAATLLAAVETAWAESPVDLSYTSIPLKVTKTEGTLVFSDCPEYARIDGILYEGTVPKGKGRLYYYHVNELAGKARLFVYAKAEKNTKITLLRTLKGDPSNTYVPTGGSLSYREIINEEEKRTTLTIPKGKKKILFEDNPEGINQEDLVSGLVEIETQSPVSLGAMILPARPNMDVEKEIEKEKYLTPDSHEMRGTFPMEIYAENEVYDFAKGPASISIGNDLAYQKGIDEMSHVERENTGDYGITYHLRIHTKGEGDFKLYINPQGGVYHGSFRIGQNPNVLGIYRTDYAKLFKKFGDGTDQDYMEIGTFHMGKDLYIKFIPAGATYLPIRFLFVPQKST